MNHWTRGLIAAAVLLPTAAARADGRIDFALPGPAAIQRLNSAEESLDLWSPVAAAAAHRVIDKYGAPDEIHSSFLVWNHAGPWARTVVFDADAAPGGHDLGLIEQTLDYALTPAQIDALASFDRRLSYNARSGQLAALSETEELNFLRMNLADDVAVGRKTPAQARAAFERAISLSFSGKTSESMRGLHFPFGPTPD